MYQSKLVKNNSIPKRTHRCIETFVFSTWEGYVNTTGGNNYVFNYTDHLGNIRLSYTQDPTTQVLTILEENHYYPLDEA